MADSKKYNQRVPSEYQEIEYLESNGTQYIDTNIIPTNSAQTKVQFEFQLTDVTNGIYQSIGCNSNMNFTSSQTLLKFRSNAIEIADFDTAWHICEMSKSSSGKVTYFDGTKYSTSTTTEAALPFILFGMSLSSDRYYSKYKLKYFKCYENNTLVRNMIPVRRKSDSQLGLYDLANNIFYTNQGSGSFTAGSDVNNWLHSLRKLGTATDTITTLPADLYADGTNATVGLVGNMQQTGTPTPQNPIQPQECGERTGNLLATLTENYAIDASGNINSNSFFMYYTAPCEPNETYTFSLDSGLSGNTVRIHAFNGDTWIEQLSGRNINLAPFTVTTPANTTNLKISITKDAIGYHTMLNEGSTPLPYEPYGYKLDIKSGSTTTPVYLGEIQSTRNIKKYEFTGQEAWVVGNYPKPDTYQFYIPKNVYFPDAKATIASGNSFCTHFLNRETAGGTAWGTNFNIYMLISDLPENATADDFKDFLAAQYAAGTPVTIWYPLANETTTTLNEPLRKIGNYADTVSSISIPTTTGKDTFDVLTTLKPSEVELTYTGWHDATVEEWDGSQWQ